MNQKLLASLKSMDPDERAKLFKAADAEDGDAPDAPDDEDEGDEDDDEDMDKSVTAGNLQKSLEALEALAGIRTPAGTAAERLGAADDVALAKSMDATGFVKSLVDSTSAHLDDLGSAVGEVVLAQETANIATLATGRLALALNKSVTGIEERLDRLLAAVNAPAQPRSTTGIQQIRKSFGEGGKAPAAQLSRGQISELLLAEQRRAGEAGDRPRMLALSKSLTDFEGGSDHRLSGEGLKFINEHLRAKAG